MYKFYLEYSNNISFFFLFLKLTETHSTFRVRLKDFRAFNLYGKDNKQVNAVIEGDFGGWKFETRILHRVINPVWPFSNIFVYRCPMAVMRDRFFTVIHDLPC